MDGIQHGKRTPDSWYDDQFGDENKIDVLTCRYAYIRVFPGRYTIYSHKRAKSQKTDRITIDMTSSSSVFVGLNKHFLIIIDVPTH